GRILEILRGSSDATADQRTFMKAVFVFWLLGATDGHAKNFSIFLKPGSEYRLAPLYDVMSVYPLISQGQLDRQKVKMAMAVRGKSKHYEWGKIHLRHWLDTAGRYRFPENDMRNIIGSTIGSIDRVIDDVSAVLPGGFPEEIAAPVFSCLSAMKSEPAI
ncbi:MAG: HipA domain-containing protein, partial [Spirochaetota bacterium]